MPATSRPPYALLYIQRAYGERRGASPQSCIAPLRYSPRRCYEARKHPTTRPEAIGTAVNSNRYSRRRPLHIGDASCCTYSYLLPLPACQGLCISDHHASIPILPFASRSIRDRMQADRSKQHTYTCKPHVRNLRSAKTASSQQGCERYTRFHTYYPRPQQLRRSPLHETTQASTQNGTRVKVWIAR